MDNQSFPLLPPVTDVIIPENPYFPTRMQEVIFKNYEIADRGRLATILGCSEDKVTALAEDMGLLGNGDTKIWEERGYITVIRENWHLLPYDQLLSLLGWDEEWLAYILKEDDFLDIKLGAKPDCRPVKYAELTEEQKERTKQIKSTVSAAVFGIEGKKYPFDFFSADEKKCGKKAKITDETGFENTAFMISLFENKLNAASERDIRVILKCDSSLSGETHRITAAGDVYTIEAASDAGILRGAFRLSELLKGNIADGVYLREPRFDVRMIYSYQGLYGNVFDADTAVSFPDELLAKYAELGINGIWMQAVLYKLVRFPFAPEISEGCEKRLDALEKLIKRAAKYGVKVYLYINEPRSMPNSFFEKYPDLMGEKSADGRSHALCTSVDKVKEYLKDSITALCRSVPDLGGLFTITMSENLTNCYSRTPSGNISCPRCKNRTPSDIAAEVNKIIYEAASSVNKNIRVFAWNWSWNETAGFDIDECIEKMPPEIAVMSVSESAMPYEIAGVSGKVVDYSISIPGPSPYSCDTWKKAGKYGHETVAKLQINNTWECPTVPYIPVFGLISRHLDALAEKSVRHLMLSWTLGGYPSASMEFLASRFFKESASSDSYASLFGEFADIAKDAVSDFDEAFSNFPFSVDTLYNGPQFCAPAGIFYPENTLLSATMTCYPFDDIKGWCGPYDAASFEECFKKLSEKWDCGIRKLSAMPECEFTYIAKACANIFRSIYNNIRFVRLRDEFGKSEGDGVRREILLLLEDEMAAVRSHIALCERNPALGYEAANHYCYTRSKLLDKLLSCEYLMDLYKNK